MDYDGNDFQNPNFQLSGEENNRFPSGLRSYSLPKFDLDDHFQANLRFDSLVESDSLLGIQDQEERSWIEDFSAGNTALDFNSCAGEPCSLSRRRNVWSDATSSESVEILLKSVGEDDVIHKTASFIDVASSDEVIGVDIHMDPSHFQSGSLDSNGAKTIDEDSILLPEKCEIEFDGANMDSAIIDDVSKNPEEVSPPDHCCTSDITTLPREESLVIEERSIEDSSKIGGESVGNSVTEETPNIAVSESDARVSDISVTESDGLMTNRIIEHHFAYFSPKNLPAMTPEDLGEQITDEGRGSLNDHSVIRNLDPEINHPSPAMEDFDNRTTSENDGLLEDVAHQIESLGKGNSTLPNEKSPDVHSPESSCLDEAAKIDSICAVNESSSPLESSEPPVLVVTPTTGSFTDSEPVLASEENEILENPLKAEGIQEVSEIEEREDHGLVSGEQGHHPNVSESPGVQKSSEDKVHEEDKFNTSDVEMPDAAKEAENAESLHSEYRSPSEEPIAETSENSALQKPRSNTESVLMSSDDLKSHIVEKPSDSLSQKPDVPAPSETQSLDEEVIPEHEENSVKLHSLPEVCNRNPMELVCDSPTKIAPVKPSSAHIANQEADKKILEEHSLSKPPQSSRSKKSSRKSKERAPSEERTFTFEVGSKSASPKSAADGWKPFSVMESFGTPQVDEMSASKSESKKANLASPSEARPLAAVTRKKDKSRPSPMGSTGKSSSKKRSTVNETPPLKDAAEKSVGTTSTPSVSASPMQREEKYQYSVNEGSGSMRFQQPFTDAQQVQLRAQIFVYGSLIQGIPPDEACMVSAFGTSVRSSWEGTWRTSLEKFNSLKSPANFPTPLPSLSGARIPEQSARSTIRSRPPVTPVSMTPNKSIGKGSSPVVSNLMPSPIWQDISHTSVPRVPHVDPGQIVSPAPVYQLSQSKEYLPGGSSPWVPQVASVPWLGPSQSLVPEKRSHFSASLTSETTPTVVRESTPPRSPNLQLMKTSSLSTPGVPLTSPGSLPGIISPPVEKKSAGTINQKSKKQKKGEGLPRGEQDNSISAPVPMPSPAPSMPVLPLSSPIPVPPTHSQLIEHKGKEQRPALSEETRSKIGQVELQAEEAAAFAAAAVKHSEGIWSQLPILRSSGLSSTAEAKIASAAAAVAAASSVAKAAAAAAKVAADAAMQAKLMADEAVVDQRSGPGFLLKGKERVSSSTTAVLSTVREMARRRVEATAAASKQAENLDAILKAAELAAVAVCQAGAVVSMGDPLPFTLNDLIEVGPGGYWKAPSTFNFGSDADDNPSALPAIEGRQESVANQTDAEYTEESLPEKANKRSIQEGSLVEVLTDKDNARRVWYSANVLSVKDDKAHVIYNELLHDTGGEKEKEWVALEGEVDQPPRIRMAHPLMSVKYEGTRKRRREAVGNYLWAVGDRVDAFIQNGWCEGVVTEKSKEDETKLTVHFSGGELSVVRAWQLRPSLVWKDGHWVEWSRLRENISYPHEGDTPKDKRQKMGTLEPAEYPKFKSIDLVEEPANLVPEASGLPLLALSEKEKIFSLGKSSSTDSRNPNLPKMKKPGPREGGPRVVFGVPKPGKKRKFMEVSKHYVAGKSGEGVKYLLPMKDAPEPESKVRKALESKPPRHPSQRQNMLARDRGQNQSEVNREESLSLVVDVSSARHVAATSAGSKKKSKDGARGTASVPERSKSEERQDQAGELRRSSRRIQPTSRLLEGLQSSMVVTKIPSSGDKAARTSSKNKPSPLPKNGAAPVHG